MAALLPTQSLADFLRSLDMPAGFDKCAPCWRCRLAPEVDTEEAMLAYFDQGIPVFAPQASAESVHEKVADRLDFVTDPRWNAFPRPKVAFQQGWAGPGTDMEDEKLHQLVASFDEVFAAADKPTGAKVLNLQYFHRSDPSAHPPIPAMSEHLAWPRCVADSSEVCDNATRVSKRGASTWWHLDDSGEFVMQTALNNKHVSPAGTEPTKLFVYGPRGSYDWVSHDAQTEASGKIAGLHLFDQLSPDEFPPPHLLPTWTVAVLRAGGRPLVSPPNIPHLVITINDCVMVEQRRVSNYFLDEVAYLLRRVQHWANTPILYTYLRVKLQDSTYVGRLVEQLKQNIVDADRRTTKDAQSVFRQKRRLFASLLAIARFPAYFAVPGGLPRDPIPDAIAEAKAAAAEEDDFESPQAAEEARRRRHAEAESKERDRLGDGNSASDMAPAEEAYRSDLMQWCLREGGGPATEALMDELEAYWDVDAAWSKAGQGSDDEQAGKSRVFVLGAHAFSAVTYPNSRPLFGPVRPTAEAAAEDGKRMLAHSEDGGAWNVKRELAKQKQAEADDVLDELF